jgi:hypothetical protein
MGKNKMKIDEYLGEIYYLLYQKPAGYGCWYELARGNKEQMFAKFNECVLKDSPHAYAIIKEERSLIVLQ